MFVLRAGGNRAAMRAAAVYDLRLSAFPSRSSRQVLFSSSSAVPDGQEKLARIIEDYRKKNFAQTMPSRFVKQVLDAVDEDKDGFVTVEEAQTLLKNIDKACELSEDELTTIMSDINCDDDERGVPLDKIRELLLPRKTT
uniref:EF-hand domain-containing protein n=1 Tax=Grammatophora oceanica TaxID=210454 RepID=A0A7S1VI06_9STRA|mmetsp:Transcript_46921/g.69780  ORF Transcript_46921/g.69780 Transcript_46921/m.69780 type:complete len:140 (+) Transcript_46921:72-491(+)|eukprot:CAMPEP_0194049496 /NCGR_PEP_ID=MMETSP0009_2-20130614/30713_1 /TAXON_ID=210454 /ORGANISM="Grammatophora oceanica, Strain CCMP 410" /LENGTH=139 /DNA_ID=CAMNT_0038695667 /DNA_START=67 /DNA_END=486 /DNA_ORIENTATION=+